MPCLACGVPTGGARYCGTHQRLTTKRSAPRPSAAARGYDRGWRRVARRVLEGDPPCHWCGAPHADTVDHVIPIRVDPSLRLDPTNLVPACRACNSGRK